MFIELLKELFITKEQVVIPDFGAFIVVREEAVLDIDASKFYPPTQKLLFSAALKNEPSDLPDLICKRLNCTKEQAFMHINGFIYEARMALQNKGEYVFEDLGKFIINPDFELEFEQAGAALVNAEYFGLPVLDLPKPKAALERSTSNNLVDLLPKSSDFKKNDVEQELVEAGPPTVGFTTEIDLSTQRRVPYMSIIGGVVVIISISVFLYYRVFSVKKPKSSKAEIAVVDKKETTPATAKSASPKPAEAQKPAATTASGTTPATTAETKPAENTQTTTPPAEQFKYYVVVGSFDEAPKAFKLRKKLMEQGFDDLTLLEPTDKSGRYRLAFGEFETLEEAKSIIAERQAEFKDQLWVHKVK